MSELRVGARLEGTDDELGTVDALVIDPVRAEVTHLVVSRARVEPRRLVPVDVVTDAAPDRIRVQLDAAGLDNCTVFDQPGYTDPGTEMTFGDTLLDPGSYFLEPFATPLDGWNLAGYERVPTGEVAVRRGTEVLSADGTSVGKLDEFVVDPSDGHITHLVLRQHHIVRHDDDVVIPVSSATRFEHDRIVLHLSLPEVEQLEKLPVRRHHHLHVEPPTST